MKPIVKGKMLTEFPTPENCFITEIQNSTAYPGLSLAKARVNTGLRTELHILKDTDEMYYILSGTGEMEVGGELVGLVEPGDLVFIPRNISQRIKNTGDNDLLFLCICSPRFEPGNYQV
ncbi:MAG: cupin domain-containing protein [Chitinophagaceae bacterium]